MDIVILLIGILTLTSLGYVINKFNSKDTDVDEFAVDLVSSPWSSTKDNETFIPVI